MKEKIAGALLVFAAFGHAAHAEWRMIKSVDSFTDEEIVEIANKGEVLTGETATTELSLLSNDAGYSLIWTPPDVYLCDHDRSLQVRAGKKIFEGQGHVLSSSRKSIFLTDSFGLMLLASRTKDVRLRYTDGCGNIAVARFGGDPSEHLPQLQIAKSLDGWQVRRSLSSTFVSRTSSEDPEAQFRVERFDDSSLKDEISIVLVHPELAGELIEKLERNSVSITIGDQAFTPRLIFIRDVDLTIGKWVLRPEGQMYFFISESDYERAAKALFSVPVVEIKYGQIRRTFDVSKMKDALIFGCGGFSPCEAGRQ
jgi:hypothetical protein